MRTSLRCDWARSFWLSVLVAIVAPGQSAAQSDFTLGKVQFAADIRLEGGLEGDTAALLNSFRSALARTGVGRSIDELQPRFVARATLSPVTEEMIPGTPPMFGLRSAINVVFLDELSGTFFSEFSGEFVATGRTREQALNNVQRQVRFSGAEWRTAVDLAESNAVGFFESRCDAVLEAANSLSIRGAYEQAVSELASVPVEASACRSRAEAAIIEAFTALQRRQCEVDLAKATTLWASDRSRENARQTAATLASIPASSPCFGEAEGLLNAVASAIEAYDAEAAARVREQLAFERQAYRDQLDRANREFSLDSLQMERGFQQAETNAQLQFQAGRENAAQEAELNRLIVQAAERSSIAWAKASRR